MNKVIVHESKLITVWCYPDHGIIHHEMHGVCYGEAFQSALNAGTEAMRKFNAKGWLSDDRANLALSPQDEEWATKIWFPATKAVGWAFWAMVKPRSAIGKLNVARFVQMYSKLGIVAEYFSQPQPALEWLIAHTAGTEE